MAESEDWLPVGKIVGAQGLKGELKVNPASDFPERFTAPGPRWVRSMQTSEPMRVQLQRGRQLPGRSLFIIRFEGVNDRKAAEALVGHELLVAADDRPDLKDGEFHLLDLVGLEARLAADAAPIGKVIDLISGGNDLLELRTADGRHLLIPFVAAIVPEVHLMEGWLLLTPPPGLLDL